ncbi:MAG TPA: ATP-binding cassette domain-containing protein [Bryobacteraceae bacterium]|nr:ATP-binding cassette domain-containing protein [Bryobacteraceae bacterium]
MSNHAALEFRISARYGETEVLHDVAGRIGPGEIVALVGLSGSGKSTLALSLLRLLEYRGGKTTGTVTVGGRETSGLSEREMRGIRGKLIGYVPQSPAAALNDRLRVRTLLAETWHAHETNPAPAGFFTRLLESVQLPGDAAFLERRAGELSAGQGQRLLIGLAILHKPAVILADEPTSSLDAITQAAILKLFGELNRASGIAMLFISHDLLSVASIAHRVEILHEGRIVESGPPETIFRSPRHPFTQKLVESMPRPLG